MQTPTCHYKLIPLKSYHHLTRPVVVFARGNMGTQLDPEEARRLIESAGQIHMHAFEVDGTTFAS
jgi:hypothetical protein